ncbi:LssY C-terminal domain-containing protein [Planctellipticum variicoloris]|uniref:LssY C-terminal domain-containing protein n=1 Tax=Planctellipticum variicoloris TaxID=3064265 RepID=UPI003013F324|nr:LssY C-terminal domain-containing protein [Planctomycetaceae bacterium SH412]
MSDPLPAANSAAPDRRRRWLSPEGIARGGLVLVLVWAVVAYIVLPLAWRIATRRHPALFNAPTRTHTASGIPGDPVNLGLIATEIELHRGILAAGWFPADPLTLKTSLRIAADTIFHREYTDAPVSSLYLFGRKEDFAFEQPFGDDPRRRHHVRFWRSPEVDADGRPVWFGAATFDERVGLSHTTGEITHHIAPDVDAERDKVLADLKKAGALADETWIDGFQSQLSGKNGGGDPWETDGRLGVGVLQAPTSLPAEKAPGDASAKD